MFARCSVQRYYRKHLWSYKADDPDPTWNRASTLTTRSQTQRGDTLVSLRVPTMDTWKCVNRDTIARLQRDDPSVQKYRQGDSVKVKGDQEVSFKENNGIVCKIYKHLKVSQGGQSDRS